MKSIYMRSSVVALLILAVGWRPFAAEIPAGPREAGRTGIHEDRKIAPQDTILVSVMNEPELSGEMKVQETGIILYHLLETVNVAGKTSSQVANEIRTRLEKDYLVDPQVTVTVKDYFVRSVNVIGAVTKPGMVEIPGEKRWTIIEAISAAGGFSDQAKRDKIEFTRDGKTQRISFNELNKIQDPMKMLFLEDGDLIDVKKKFF